MIFVIYGAFNDDIDVRHYYDVIIADEGIAIVKIGSLPTVYKHRSPLPRNVELFLMRLSKEKSRRSYDDVDRLIRSGRAMFVPQEDIACCTVREREIPIPPILRKPPSNPREKPRYVEQVLELSIFTTSNTYRFYTSTKLKDSIKWALKEAGMYIPKDIVFG